MNIYVAAQTVLFLQSLLVGVALGVIYEPFRLVRAAFGGPAWVVFAEDILYSLITAFVTFSFLLSEETGKIRFALLVGEAIGMLLYFFTVGDIVAGVAAKIVKTVKTVIKWVFSKMFFPIFKLILRPIKALLKEIKKIIKNIKIHLKVDMGIVYNQYVSVFSFKKQRIRTRNNERKAAGKEKRLRNQEDTV